MSATCHVVDCNSAREKVLPLLVGGEIRLEYAICAEHDGAIRGGAEYIAEHDGDHRSGILMGSNLPPRLKSISSSGVGNVPVLYLNLDLRNGEEEQVAVAVTPGDLEMLGNPFSKESMFQAPLIAEQ